MDIKSSLILGFYVVIGLITPRVTSQGWSQDVDLSNNSYRVEMEFKIDPMYLTFNDEVVAFTCSGLVPSGFSGNITLRKFPKFKITQGFESNKYPDILNEVTLYHEMKIRRLDKRVLGTYCCELNYNSMADDSYINECKDLQAVVGLDEPCNSTLQCNKRSYCTMDGYCKCQTGYLPKGGDCLTNEKKSKDIYKAAMVALACFMVTIIGLFVLFVCNKSFLRRGLRSRGPLDDHLDSRRSSDIFNVAEGLAAMRHVDKPPTYQQVVAQEMIVRGCPPPSYTEIAPTSTAGQRPHRDRIRIVGRHPPLTRTIWPNERENNSEPAVLSLRTNELMNRHADRGHVTLNNNSDRRSFLNGSVNSAFVSDA